MQIIVYGNCNHKDHRSPLNVFGDEKGKRRLALIKVLHQKKEIGAAIRENGWNPQTVRQDLLLLEEATFIKKEGDKYRPNFFVALADELFYVPAMAQELAIGLVNPIQDWFTEIRNLTDELSFAERFAWSEINFLIIGNFIFELGTQYIANSGENLFLSPYPNRKSGFYFLLAIETNSLDILGHYRSSYCDLTEYFFCMYGAPNAVQAFDNKIFPLIKKKGLPEAKKEIIHTIKIYEDHYRGVDRSLTLEHLLPFSLITGTGRPLVPLGSKADCKIIQFMARSIGTKIGLLFDRYYNMLFEAYRSFRTANNSGFSEFYSWFYKLVANRAMDILLGQGLVNYPPTGTALCILKEYLDFPG